VSPDRVGVMLVDPRIVDGTHVVEALVDGRWAQYSGHGGGIIASRSWGARDSGWSVWASGILTVADLAAACRLVPAADAWRPPAERGELA
jgi:hypothetical protein